MSLEKDVDRGARAESLLKNELFNEAFDEMKAAIVARMEQIDFRDTEEAKQLLLSLKLLRAVRAKFEQAVRDGKVASFRLDEQQRTQ